MIAYLRGAFGFSNLWTKLTYCLFSCYFVLVTWTFDDYGITWDEHWHSIYGELIIKWYTSQFNDRGVLEFWNLWLYGGFFDVVSQLAAKISPFGVFETRHFVGGLFGLLCIGGAYKLGKHMAGPLAGFLSALFLILTPRFYGHAFTNPKDIPFAALFMFSLYYIIKSVGFMPRIPRELLVKLGVSIGLTLGVRFGGVILFAYLGLAFCLWEAAQQFQNSTVSSWVWSFKLTLAKMIRSYLWICPIAYACMIVWWPSAQVEPVTHPLRTLWKTAHFDWPYDVFFEGRMISAEALPWHYGIKWYLITLPEFYFVGLVIGMVLFAVVIARFKSVFCDSTRFLQYLLLLFFTAFPVVYTAATGAVLYDGLRHLLFITPPLAVIAACSVAELVRKQSLRPLRMVVVAAIVISLSLTANHMVELHPYESVYFNHLFGKGVGEASKSFETDYWGISYKEGVEWIVKNYRGRSDDTPIKVASCSHPRATEYYLPGGGFKYVGSVDYKVTESPDLFLATTRWNCHHSFEGRVVHVVTRKGAPLLYIKQIDKNR